jgi:hypothetical protein
MPAKEQKSKELANSSQTTGCLNKAGAAGRLPVVETPTQELHSFSYGTIMMVPSMLGTPPSALRSSKTDMEESAMWDD